MNTEERYSTRNDSSLGTIVKAQIQRGFTNKALTTVVEFGTKKTLDRVKI